MEDDKTDEIERLAKQEWQGPLLAPAPYYAGKTGRAAMRRDVERYGNGAYAGRRDKPARRQIRRALGGMRSRIETSILRARKARLELERLASNSHEAKRYFEADRLDTLRKKKWRVDWSTMWKKIGEAYASLLQFVRQAP